jgi:DNA-binding response OmpR family regulator
MIAFLTDRRVADALPSLPILGLDVKTEPLGRGAPLHVRDLTPSAIIVDAVPDPERAHALAASIASSRAGAPVVVLVARADLDRFAWETVADEVVLPDASPAELRMRFAMLARRSGGAGEAVLRLGPLSINTDSYQVLLAGRYLDLTYKEFELMRFLVQRTGRVFTRSALLREVWGYDFYGGTRTVDVHVRRLRAKLGPEHETLIETVRGVGYRVAERREDD